MKRSLICGVVACALAASIGGSHPPAAAQSGGGKTLIIALDQSDVRTLDPGREFEFGAAFVDLNVYDTLVAHKSPFVIFHQVTNNWVIRTYVKGFDQAAALGTFHFDFTKISKVKPAP